MNIYYPSNLDILSILPAKEHKHFQKYLYVVHKIVEHGIHYPNTECRLNNRVLRSILGSKWPDKIFKNLRKWEIIIRYDRYINGKQSFAYGLTPLYYSNQNQTMKLTDKTITKNIGKWKDRLLQDKTIKWLYENLNKVDVSMGIYGGIINSLYYGASFFTEHQHKCIHVAISKILEKDFYINRDLYGNRIHTNITSLKRELRKCLIVDGEPLVELDIANSQPFFFSMVLKEFYTDLPEDVIKYTELTQNGTFYQYMSEHLSTPLTPEFKELLFARVFFCDKFFNSVYDESLKFFELFPNVYKTIIDLKSTDKDELNKRLQNMESKMIIDTIVTRIMKDRPDMFVTTIHDGIMIKRSDELYVSNLMMDEFNRLGFKPTIRAK